VRSISLCLRTFATRCDDTRRVQLSLPRRGGERVDAAPSNPRCNPAPQAMRAGVRFPGGYIFVKWCCHLLENMRSKDRRATALAQHWRPPMSRFARFDDFRWASSDTLPTRWRCSHGATLQIWHMRHRGRHEPFGGRMGPARAPPNSGLGELLGLC
jgi:hypothetical protein